jgi:L-fuculose-phosphate aldolase
VTGVVPASSEQALRNAIVRVCRRLWERGLIAGQSGNVSVRLNSEQILVTPAGFSKVDVTPDDLVVLGLDGRPAHQTGAASTESAVHLRAYARRPDVAAVVHAHPPIATGFALAGETLPQRVLPEIDALLGAVPLVPFASPGTEALADQFDAFWAGHDAFLMSNHGALTLGPNLRAAHQRMETLEHAAHVVATARALGHVFTLESRPAAASSDGRAPRSRV